MRSTSSSAPPSPESGSRGAAPRVSIVVLTHERPAALRRCLESLLAQRGAPPYEIVVADDGSGPATAAAVGELAARAAAVDGAPRLVAVRHAHQGIAATRNLGLAAAQGELVGFVADDYVLAPDYLARAVDYLDRHPEAAVVRFRIALLERHWGGRISHLYYDASIRRRLLREATPAGATARQLWRAARAQLAAAERPLATRALEAAGAAIFRAPLLRAVGGFDVALARGEDTEFTARWRARGHVVHLLPAPRVAHAYDRLPLDTLRKCWLTGRNLRRALQRMALAGPAGPPAGGRSGKLARCWRRICCSSRGAASSASSPSPSPGWWRSSWRCAPACAARGARRAPPRRRARPATNAPPEPPPPAAPPPSVDDSRGGRAPCAGAGGARRSGRRSPSPASAGRGRAAVARAPRRAQLGGEHAQVVDAQVGDDEAPADPPVGRHLGGVQRPLVERRFGRRQAAEAGRAFAPQTPSTRQPAPPPEVEDAHRERAERRGGRRDAPPARSAPGSRARAARRRRA